MAQEYAQSIRWIRKAATAGDWNDIVLTHYPKRLVVSANGSEIVALPGVELPKSPIAAGFLPDNLRHSNSGGVEVQAPRFRLDKLSP